MMTRVRKRRLVGSGAGVVAPGTDQAAVEDQPDLVRAADAQVVPDHLFEEDPKEASTLDPGGTVEWVNSAHLAQSSCHGLG